MESEVDVICGCDWKGTEMLTDYARYTTNHAASALSRKKSVEEGVFQFQNVFI